MTGGGSRISALSKMEFFATAANAWKPLSLITKCPILDVEVLLGLPLETWAYNMSCFAKNLSEIKYFSFRQDIFITVNQRAECYCLWINLNEAFSVILKRVVITILELPGKRVVITVLELPGSWLFILRCSRSEMFYEISTLQNFAKLPKKCCAKMST